MTPEEQRQYYKTIQRMSDGELKTRIANFKLLLSKQKIWIQLYQEVVDNPEKAKKKLEEAKERYKDYTEQRAILHIKLKGLVDGQDT